MSANPKIMKVLAVFLGAAGAAICIASAFLFAEDTVSKVVLLLLSVVFLVLIFPLYRYGNAMEELIEQNKKLTQLTSRQAKLLKDADPAGKYSPFAGKPLKPRTGDTASYAPTQSGRPFYDTIAQIASVQGASRPRVQTGENVRTPRKRVDAATGEVVSIPDKTHTLDSDAIQLRFARAKQPTQKIFRRNVLAAGGVHTIAVRSNGTACAVGYENYGQCEVAGWHDIISVAAGTHHTIGVRADGFCIACGYNGSGQCEVTDWSGVVNVAAGTSHTVGLLQNGTCIAVGDNTYGQCNVMNWTDIVAISASANCTVGLRSDGTVVGVGANTNGHWAAIKWGGLTDVAVGGFHTVGLKNDGSCVATGNNSNKQCDVARWHEIRAVAAGAFHSVGLCKDGTVVAIGHNGHGQCNTETWADIVAIAAGRNHTVGLMKNGDVVAVGDNAYSQCFVQDMHDIHVS